MITAILIFLLANVILSEKVELNYTSASYVLLTTSKIYKDELESIVNEYIDYKIIDFESNLPNSFAIIGLKVVTGKKSEIKKGQTLPK